MVSYEIGQGNGQIWRSKNKNKREKAWRFSVDKWRVQKVFLLAHQLIQDLILVNKIKNLLNQHNLSGGVEQRSGDESDHFCHFTFVLVLKKTALFLHSFLLFSFLHDWKLNLHFNVTHLKSGCKCIFLDLKTIKKRFLDFCNYTIYSQTIVIIFIIIVTFRSFALSTSSGV